MELLGVPITTLSREAILSRVSFFLTEERWHRIATVNPEFLVRAQQNSAFKQSLLEADLCVADGFGIVLAGLFSGQGLTRVPGIDLMEEILKIADEQKLSLYLAIRKDGLSSYEEIKSVLLKKYSRLVVDGAEFDINECSSSLISYPSSTIMLCNFGAPEQELFLENLRENPGTLRLTMGVGGSFDYLTKKLTRAPKELRTMGLEWLWRLTLQPCRFKRIWNAVIVFSFLVVLSWRKSKKRL